MARLEDRILQAKPVLMNLRTRFTVEGEADDGTGQYYGIIHFADGQFWDDNPYSPELDGAQAVFARDVLKLLNRELHHDGAWTCVFTHPKPVQIPFTFAEYARFGFIWLDADGDPQFTLEWAEGESEERDFPDLLMNGLESWGHKCEAAWQSWHHAMRQVLAPKAGQLIKKAQGQQYATA